MRLQNLDLLQPVLIELVLFELFAFPLTISRKNARVENILKEIRCFKNENNLIFAVKIEPTFVPVIFFQKLHFTELMNSYCFLVSLFIDPNLPSPTVSKT